jgi:hypothetical protein
MGRPYVDEHGVALHRNSEWVKTVDENGRIENHDWGSVYSTLRKAAGVTQAGYLWHEGVHWDEEYRRWVFLPRKRSMTLTYSEKADEIRGTNIVLIASEDFEDVTVVEGVGPWEPKYGFSTIRKVPGSSDVFMAVKVKEIGEDVHSVSIAWLARVTLPAHTPPQLHSLSMLRSSRCLISRGSCDSTADGRILGQLSSKGLSFLRDCTVTRARMNRARKAAAAPSFDAF